MNRRKLNHTPSKIIIKGNDKIENLLRSYIRLKEAFPNTEFKVELDYKDELEIKFWRLK